MFCCRRYKFIQLFLAVSTMYGLVMYQLGLNYRHENSSSSTGVVQMEEEQLEHSIQAVAASDIVAAPETMTKSKTDQDAKLTDYIEPRLIERQLERHRHIIDVCLSRMAIPDDAVEPSQKRKRLSSINREDGLPHPDEFGYIRVLEELKILYCEVPKVACTNWKRILVYLTGKSNATSPDKIDHYDLHGRLSDMLIPRLSTYSPQEIQHRLSTYFKFMFVREPLDRLRSVYVDKFSVGDNSLFNDRYGVQIVAMYRPNATNASLTRGNDVQHGEFVRYLVDPRSTASEHIYDHYYAMDPHWRSMENLCHPCYVGYDFIGKYETLNEDFDHAMKIMGLHEVAAQFPSAESSSLAPRLRKPKKSPKTVKGASKVPGYADVPAADVKKLVEVYSDDFRMFGYSYPSELEQSRHR